MTLNELYAKSPEIVSKDLNRLKNFTEPVIYETGQLLDHEIEVEQNQRVEILYYAYDEQIVDSWEEKDGDLIVEKLGAIKFDDLFVMAFLMTGSGGGNLKRFITDKTLYDEMAGYVKTLLPEDEGEEQSGRKRRFVDLDSQDDVVEPGTTIEDLEAFSWLKNYGEDDEWLEECVHDEPPF